MAGVRICIQQTLRLEAEEAVKPPIVDIKRMGYIPEQLYQQLPEIASLMAEHGDILLYGGDKKRQVVDIFNKITLAIAILAFQPGGIEIFDYKFEASFLDKPEWEN
ncbi:hypothetical protein JYQ62_22050 [Nostoc sp. UHCC 0702]|nr:hypothetical protein JYQ62_22050 [Nostoc sp. UHCC 0702]